MTRFKPYVGLPHAALVTLRHAPHVSRRMVAEGISISGHHVTLSHLAIFIIKSILRPNAKYTLYAAQWQSTGECVMAIHCGVLELFGNEASKSDPS